MPLYGLVGVYSIRHASYPSHVMWHMWKDTKERGMCGRTLKNIKLIMFMKPVWDDIWFMTWYIMMLEVDIRRILTNCSRVQDIVFKILIRKSSSHAWDVLDKKVAWRDLQLLLHGFTAIVLVQDSTAYLESVLPHFLWWRHFRVGDHLGFSLQPFYSFILHCSLLDGLLNLQLVCHPALVPVPAPPGLTVPGSPHCLPCENPA